MEGGQGAGPGAAPRGPGAGGGEGRGRGFRGGYWWEDAFDYWYEGDCMVVGDALVCTDGAALVLVPGRWISASHFACEPKEDYTLAYKFTGAAVFCVDKPGRHADAALLAWDFDHRGDRLDYLPDAAGLAALLRQALRGAAAGARASPVPAGREEARGGTAPAGGQATSRNVRFAKEGDDGAGRGAAPRDSVAWGRKWAGLRFDDEMVLGNALLSISGPGFEVHPGRWISNSHFVCERWANPTLALHFTETAVFVKQESGTYSDTAILGWDFDDGRVSGHEPCTAEFAAKLCHAVESMAAGIPACPALAGLEEDAAQLLAAVQGAAAAAAEEQAAAAPAARGAAAEEQAAAVEEAAALAAEERAAALELARDAAAQQHAAALKLARDEAAEEQAAALKAARAAAAEEQAAALKAARAAAAKEQAAALKAARAAAAEEQAAALKAARAAAAKEQAAALKAARLAVAEEQAAAVKATRDAAAAQHAAALELVRDEAAEEHAAALELARYEAAALELARDATAQQHAAALKLVRDEAAEEQAAAAKAARDEMTERHAAALEFARDEAAEEQAAALKAATDAAEQHTAALELMRDELVEQQAVALKAAMDAAAEQYAAALKAAKDEAAEQHAAALMAARDEAAEEQAAALKAARDAAAEEQAAALKAATDVAANQQATAVIAAMGKAEEEQATAVKAARDEVAEQHAAALEAALGEAAEEQAAAVKAATDAAAERHAAALEAARDKGAAAWQASVIRAAMDEAMTEQAVAVNAMQDDVGKTCAAAAVKALRDEAAKEGRPPAVLALFDVALIGLKASRPAFGGLAPPEPDAADHRRACVAGQEPRAPSTASEPGPSTAAHLALRARHLRGTAAATNSDGASSASSFQLVYSRDAGTVPSPYGWRREGRGAAGSAASSASDGSLASWISAGPGRDREPRCFLSGSLLWAEGSNGRNLVQACKLQVGSFVHGVHKVLEVAGMEVLPDQECLLVELDVGEDVPKLTVTATHRIVATIDRASQTVLARDLKPGDRICCSSSARKLRALKLFRQTATIVQLTFRPDEPVEAFDAPFEAILSKGRPRTRRGRLRGGPPRADCASIPDTEWEFPSSAPE